VVKTPLEKKDLFHNDRNFTFVCSRLAGGKQLRPTDGCNADVVIVQANSFIWYWIYKMTAGASFCLVICI